MLERINFDAEIKSGHQHLLASLRLGAYLSVDSIDSEGWILRTARLIKDEELAKSAQGVIGLEQSHLRRVNGDRRKVQQNLTQYQWSGIWPSINPLA